MDDRELSPEEQREAQKNECLFLKVKLQFFVICKEKSPEKKEQLRTELVELIKAEPGAKAAFDCVVSEIEALAGV